MNSVATLIPPTPWLVIAHFAATLWMVGLIWFVQVVHYPLMGRVGNDQFIEYERTHQHRTTLVVGLPMLVELLTAVILVFRPPAGVSALATLAGLLLLAVIWISTGFLQVPMHERLGRGFDAGAHAWLVGSNWIRTVAWTARGVLAAYFVARLIPQH